MKKSNLKNNHLKISLVVLGKPVNQVGLIKLKLIKLIKKVSLIKLIRLFSPIKIIRLFNPIRQFKLMRLLLMTKKEIGKYMIEDNGMKYKKNIKQGNAVDNKLKNRSMHQLLKKNLSITCLLL